MKINDEMKNVCQTEQEITIDEALEKISELEMKLDKTAKERDNYKLWFNLASKREDEYRYAFEAIEELITEFKES